MADILNTPAVEGAAIPAHNNPPESKLESAKESALAAKDKIQEKVGELSDKASKMASDIPQKADDALATVGDKMLTMADKLREKAPSKLVDGLESGGDYLSSHGVPEIAADVTDIIRKYPVQSLWVGIGVGVLLGAALSRR